MDTAEQFKRCDSRRLSSRFSKNVHCVQGARCSKQHYFPHDVNFCRAEREGHSAPREPELIVDDLPPRCSTPIPSADKDASDRFDNSLDERQYAFWYDDFANNVGPMASPNGVVSCASSPAWFPLYTYVCLVQPKPAPVRKSPEPSPPKRPSALLSYLQRATNHITAKRVAAAASGQVSAPKNFESDQKDLRRMSTAFENLNLNKGRPAFPADVTQEQQARDPRLFDRRQSVQMQGSALVYTRYLAQSRIFPQLIAHPQAVSVSPPEHVIINHLPSSYDQFCETVQYRQLPTMNYGRLVNAVGNDQVWY